MSKRTYRIRNWKDYNKSLVERGRITFWINEKVFEEWQNPTQENKRGRPRLYTNLLISAILMVRSVYHLPLRATEGLMRSLVGLNGLEIGVPDYTTICKRQKTVKLSRRKAQHESGLKHIVIDTTGLKFYGEGEWKVRKHGYSKKRGWRKLHLAIDIETQQIEALRLTDNDVHDCQCIEEMIQEIPGNIGQITGDGAYDKFSSYKAAHDRGAQGIFPPIHHAKTTEENKKLLKRGAFEIWRQRDETILAVRELGEKAWKEKTNYHKRSLSETAMFRFKKIFSGELRARHFEHQIIEAKIKCQALNLMTGLGMPDSYPVTI